MLSVLLVLVWTMVALLVLCLFLMVLYWGLGLYGRHLKRRWKQERDLEDSRRNTTGTVDALAGAVDFIQKRDREEF